MPKLLTELENLWFYLLDFCYWVLVSSTSDMLVTLIYHKKTWRWVDKFAKQIEQKLNIKIIGRSRKQKKVLRRIL